MNRLFLSLSLAAGLMACGGKHGTLKLEIITTPAENPFLNASTVRVTIGDTGTVQTAPINATGGFSLDLSPKPDANKSEVVLVEALDAQGQVVAYGNSPILSLQPQDNGPIGVWVARPNSIVSAATSLPKDYVRYTGVSAVNVPNLGVVYAGGFDGTAATTATAVYYLLNPASTIVGAAMNHARGNANLISTSGTRAVIFGGAAASDGSAPTASPEIFDPSEASGLWAALTGDVVDARSLATQVTLGSGAVLISGGLDSNKARLRTAALINTDASPRVTALSSVMFTPRVGHCGAAARFPDGDGAILFGGLPAGSSDPVAERLIGGQVFAQYIGTDLATEPSRDGATCTSLSDGSVLVLGGADSTGALDSGLVISPGTVPTVRRIPAAMTTARVGHTATLVKNQILVCGGADKAGVIQKSCDLLDAASGAILSTLQLGYARRDHSAVLIDTGVVVIAGGLIEGGNPTTSIEIYTPPQQ